MTHNNPITGTIYSGKNISILSEAKMENHYSTTEWVTFVQARNKGWKVKKGAKGVTLTKYLKLENNANDVETTSDDKKKVVTKPYRFTVFNIDCIETN